MNTAHSLQSALGMSLLHSLWQVALIAVVAASVLVLLERRSAATRHSAGMAFLLAMAAAPVATFAWLMAQPAAGDCARCRCKWLVGDERDANARCGIGQLDADTGVGAVAVVHRRDGDAGALVGGWRVVRSLDHQAFSPLPAQWVQRADSLRRALGIRRDVAIRLLHDAGLPCSARAWRPIVWLPISMLTQLDADQIEALIAHELAHIRRLDWIWNGLQCAIEALLFYHPGMWWLSRRIRQERENACDDLAVAVCGDAIVLAEALATLERHRMPRHVLALSATGGALMHRVTRLLSPDQPTRLRWVVPVGVMAIVCSGALLAAQLQPGSSTAGSTTFDARGNSFKLSESSLLGGDRVYRQSINADGKVTETYTVDGKPTKIDASTRVWITRMHIAAATDAPPPPPPACAALTPRCSAAAATATVAAVNDPDRAVPRCRAGPATGRGCDCDGRLAGRGGEVSEYSHLTEDHADLTFVVSGPKGKANVRAQMKLQAGVWHVSNLDLEGN